MTFKRFDVQIVTTRDGRVEPFSYGVREVTLTEENGETWLNFIGGTTLRISVDERNAGRLIQMLGKVGERPNNVLDRYSTQ